MKKFAINLISKIEKYQTIIIHRHQSPDGDALGSQYGFAFWLRNNFPNKKILIASENDINLLPTFFLLEDNPKEEDYKDSLVIVCDTSNKERIANSNYIKAKEIIKIDHHPIVDNYGSFSFVDPERSSCAEIIFDIFYLLKDKYKISLNVANYLFLGILTDSGRFSFPSVNSKTFSTLTNLFDIKDFDSSFIYQSLNDKTENDIKYQAYVMANYKQKNGLAIFFAPKKIEQKFYLEYKKITFYAFCLMMSKETNIGIYITYDFLNKQYRISCRSKKIPINDLLSKYGGGGHKLASGVKIKDKSNVKKLIKDLKILNLKN